jgi:hypothetical protein
MPSHSQSSVSRRRFGAGGEALGSLPRSGRRSVGCDRKLHILFTALMDQFRPPAVQLLVAYRRTDHCHLDRAALAITGAATIAATGVSAARAGAALDVLVALTTQCADGRRFAADGVPRWRVLEVADRGGYGRAVDGPPGQVCAAA